MKFRIKHFKIVSKVSGLLSLLSLCSSVLANNIFSPSPIIEKMYQSPKGLEAIVSALSLEISRTRVISISELAFVLFLGIAAVMELYCRVKLLEDKLEKIEAK